MMYMHFLKLMKFPTPCDSISNPYPNSYLDVIFIKRVMTIPFISYLGSPYLHCVPLCLLCFIM